MRKKIARNQPLSVEQAHTAQTMLETGSTVKDVAEQLGLVYKNGAAHNRLKAAGIDIRAIRNKAGLTFDPWVEEIPKIKKMLQEGLGTKDLANYYNKSQKEIYSVLYRRGISVRRERYYGANPN